MITIAMGDPLPNILCPNCRASNPTDSRFCNKCGNTLGEKPATLTYPSTLQGKPKEALSFSPGELFGTRYRIIEEIGRGGMGRVYKAEDLELGITVALKMIRPEYSSSRTMIEHFKKETLLARSISHENVVRTHDLGEIDQIKYISMDFIKGGNLKDLIQTSGRLSLETCHHIAAQICDALKAAHGKSIVHLDLKPQNIMIDHSGKVYITDFGLARSVTVPETRATKKIYGTPQYFSPEQARGEDADERADIYALGVILYEMVAGTLPFQGKTTEDYIRKHISETPVSPSKFRADIPASLDKVILKCLEKKKEDRYPSVEALFKDLNIQFKAVEQSQARKKKTRFLRAAAAAVVLLAAAGGLYLLNPRRPAAGPAAREGRTAVAVLFAVNTSQDKTLDHLRWEIPELMIAGLAESKFLSLLPMDRLFQILARLRQLDAGQHTSEMLDKIRSAENIGYFVLPSFVRAGERVWIGATIRKAESAEIVGSADVQGTPESLLALVQDLNLKVRSKFIAAPEDAAGEHQALDKITTPSLEALGDYVESERLYALGDFEGSIKVLEKAVQSDPEYAMAYWKLAENYDYLENRVLAKKNIEKALSLLNRVSQRDRYLIQGYAALSLESSSVKAVESYKKLLAFYPNDETGLSYLGSTYRNMERWDEAQEQFEKVRTLNPRNLLNAVNLAFIYTAKGWYPKALDFLQEYKPIFPEVAFFPNQMALIHVIQGQYDLADAEVKAALVRTPNDGDNLEFQGIIEHLRGNLITARKIYERLQKSEDGTGGLRGRIWLGHIASMRGEFRQSRSEFQQGIEIARRLKKEFEEMEFRWQLGYRFLQAKRFSEAVEMLRPVAEISRKSGSSYHLKSTLNLLGIAELGLGRLGEAKAEAIRIFQYVETAGSPGLMRYYHHLQGKIALTENRPMEAVDELKKALALLPSQRERLDEHAFFMDALAEAYERAGDLDQAADMRLKILKLTTGRLRWGDIYARSHYQLGRFCQSKNLPSEAASYFKKFLELWGNADSGSPEVDDAKKQWTLLTKSPRP